MVHCDGGQSAPSRKVALNHRGHTAATLSQNNKHSHGREVIWVSLEDTTAETGGCGGLLTGNLPATG